VPKRIASLDGLRALGIIGLLLAHSAGTAGAPHALMAIFNGPYVDVAHFGVRVFFVISGFLITGLLMAEEAKTGTVSLSRFYLRRTLRIFPAYYAFLVVLALLTVIGVIVVPAANLARAVTYTMNYTSQRVWLVGHLWSLAVEEQFYLIWPLTIMLVGTKNAARVAVAVVLLAPLIRVIEATFAPRLIPLIGNSFETTADALAMGCLLALWQARLEDRPWYQRAIASRWVVPALLLLSVGLSLRYRSSLLIGETITNVGVALLIARSVTYTKGPWGRLLNAGPMVVLGTLSYSLYLWQQLFLNRNAPGLLTSFPLNLLLTFACAVVSYFLIEQPFLRLRMRLEARRAGPSSALGRRSA
jgi:peptidoglycan/LPS O-acetylase OafA/YrhL